MQEALKREFITQYLDVDGLCHLENEKGLTHCQNSNGVLFAAYGYMILHKHKMLDGADYLRFYHTIKTLTVEPGLYKRRPDADQVTEAHDNRTGIAVAALLLDQLQTVRDLQDYGDRMGYQYANTDTSKFSWKQLTQGGDIALYKICCGRMPYITEWVWMLGGMAVSVFKGWSSTWNLFYLRAYGVSHALERFGTSAWLPYRVSWNLVSPLLHYIASKRFGGFRESLKQYFSADHILYRMETDGNING
jgi:hypothetical protein